MNSYDVDVAVVGAGPAGLMAAEVLARKGVKVTVFERMPSPARKFLMAGRGGLNLTHSEPIEVFKTRYGSGSDHLAPILDGFLPSALMLWAQNLGQKTFVGSSGRVFPVTLKTSPLLRAWLARLSKLGVQFKFRHDWTGLQCEDLAGEKSNQRQILTFNVRPDSTEPKSGAGSVVRVSAKVVILAVGGASWPRLGANGKWVSILKNCNVAITPLTAFNVGINIGWSKVIKDSFAGAPLKRISARVGEVTSKGEAIVTKTGLEGGVIYNLNRAIRDELCAQSTATLTIDLRPDLTLSELTKRLAAPRSRQSTATFLRKAAQLSKPAIAILREPSKGALPNDANALAQLIKSVSFDVSSLCGLERAISSSGGIDETELDETGMLVRLPGVFTAGEMRNWDAPTGGYLLQAAFSTGVQAGLGARVWLKTMELEGD